MDTNPLVAFVERLRAAKPVYDWQPVVEEQRFLERKLKSVPPPEVAHAAGSIDDARRIIRQALRDYLEDPVPVSMLLIKASPGTGKTTLAVEIADALAASGKRVAYAGPRHDLYLDVVAKSGDPSLWYEWQPRQIGDEEKPQTCRYTDQMNTWLHKGYQAMDFCSGVCHWDYVKECPYHLQSHRREPIIYVQHQHVTLGHPIEFGVLFGDESPLQAFTREWRIPARWVLPPGMDYTEPLTSLLYVLSALCETTDRPVQGKELIEILGGADEVIQACESFVMPIDELAAAGEIHHADQVERMPYFHLFDLAPLLLREARQAQAGVDYPQRIIAAEKHLTLLLRRTPDYTRLPPHVVWMDATGRPEIYKAIFRRQVDVVDAAPKLWGNVYQVVDRANGKRSLENTGKRDQTKTLIQKIIEYYGYERPSVIGFKSFVDELDLKTAHFYAARGTNAHEDADAIIIVGAPQPNIYDVVKLAKMVYFDRNDAFRVVWCSQEVTYPYVDPTDGQGRSYPVSGFWKDLDLQSLVEVMREDEIVQAAHRGRPVNKPVDIWLLTNVPIQALPPTQLLTMREVLQAPEGVDIFKWGRVQALVETREEIAVSDLEAVGISRKTASEYIDRIAELPGWEKAARRTNTRGKPPKTARRTGITRNDILNGEDR